MGTVSSNSPTQEELAQLHQLIASGDPAEQLASLVGLAPTAINCLHEDRKAMDVAVELLAKCYREGEPSDGEVYRARHQKARKIVQILKEHDGQLENMDKDRLSTAVTANELPQVKALCQVITWSKEALSRAAFAAVTWGRVSHASFLQELQGQQVWQNQAGRTPFLQALWDGKEEVAQALWSKADHTATDKRGNNAFDCAIKGKLWSLATKLDKEGQNVATTEGLIRLADTAGPHRFNTLFESEKNYVWNEVSEGMTILDRLAIRLAGSLRQGDQDGADQWFLVMRKLVTRGADDHYCSNTVRWSLIESLPSERLGEALGWFSFSDEILTQALHYKVEKKDLVGVTALVKRLGNRVDGMPQQRFCALLSGGTPYMVACERATALMKALESAWPDGASVLLQHADLTLKGPGGKTLLDYALTAELHDLADKIHEMAPDIRCSAPQQTVTKMLSANDGLGIRLLHRMGQLKRESLLVAIAGLSSEQERLNWLGLFTELFPVT